MAQRSRHRRHRRFGRSQVRGLMGQVTKWLPLASFESTFLGNAVDNINAQSTFGAKIKTIINAHTGKVTGINLFNDVPKFGVAIGFQNVGNPLTIAGLTMLAVGAIGRRFGLPYTGRLKTIGGKIAFPSAIGALFTGDAGTGFISATPTISTSSGSTI